MFKLAVTKYLYTKRRRILDAWTRFLKEKKINHSKKRKAQLLYISYSLKKCIKLWRLRTSRKLQLRIEATKVKKAKEFSLLRRHLTLWYFLFTLFSGCRHRRMKNMFFYWKNQRGKTKLRYFSRKIADKYHRQINLRRYIKWWMSYSYMHRVSRIQKNNSVNFYLVHLLKKVFMSWKGRTAMVFHIDTITRHIHVRLIICGVMNNPL